MKATRIAKTLAVLASTLALSAALAGVAAAGETEGGEGIQANAAPPRWSSDPRSATRCAARP